MPNDRVQLPAALLTQNPSRGQEARPVSCNELVRRPLCRKLIPRSFLVGHGGGVEPPRQVAHLVGGSDFPLHRRRGEC